MVEEVEGGTLYTLIVWVKRYNVNNTNETIDAATTLNRVSSLRVQDLTNSSITLSWTVPSGPEQTPYTYQVQWSREDSIQGAQRTSDTNITVKDLDPGTLYIFTVSVETDNTNSTNETIDASTAPNTVSSLRVQDLTNSSITLSWTAPLGPDQPPYTYWVQWSSEDSVQGTQNTSDTNITVEELEPGVLYTFTVWVEQNGINSANETINASTVPNTVTNLVTQDQTNSSITLSWTAPLGPDQPPYTYWVQWSRGDSVQGTQNTSDTKITVEELEPGVLYTFTVWVEQNGTNSANETIDASTVPNAVTNLVTQDQTNSSITLSWTAPLGPDQPPYTYWVQWSRGDSVQGTQNTSDTKITVKELEPGVLYTFTVWVERNGINSTNETIDTSTVPNAVTNLVTQDQTNSSITLSWTAPLGPDQPPYTYWVQWSSEDSVQGTQNTSDIKITVEELEPGVLYTFTVWVEQNGINSANETIDASTVPNAVTNLVTQDQTNSSITLSWTAPLGPDKPPYTYWVQWSRGDSVQGTQNTSDTKITVKELEPGVLYTFTVWVERNGINSTNETIDASTVPNAVTNLVTQDQTNSSITLRWTAPLGPDQPPYTYWVQWSTEDRVQGTQNTSDTKITVEELEPGVLYTFTIWVERNGINSTNETTDASTVPNTVTNLVTQDQTNSSITLNWTAPLGAGQPPYTYWVKWSREESVQGTQNTSDTKITVKELEPGVLYTFTVWVERNGINSTNETIDASTVPNTVTSLGTQDQTNSSIALSWTAPLGPEQPPCIYWVQCLRNSSVQRTLNTSDIRITVTELEPGTLYICNIWVERNGINSGNETIDMSTIPNEVIDLNTTQTNNSVTLMWKPPTDSNSPLYTYWVHWTSGEQPQREKYLQRGEINQTAKTNETYYTVKALSPGTRYFFSVWAEIYNVSSFTKSVYASTAPDSVTSISCVSTSGGYGVILTWSCPEGGHEVFMVKVGRQDFQDTSSCGIGVSFLGFQPAQSYLATVTTVWDGMRAPLASTICYTESAGVIAGSIVGVLLFLLLVGLLVFFLKKRRNKKSQEKQAPRDLALSFPGDILAKDFAEHVRKNEKDSNCGFAEEYQQLALEGHDQPHMVASAPENNGKNRYRNVLPYDWSRVPLNPIRGEPGSDYVNASFMPGLWSSQEFIAAQGPLSQTVGDFWRLVWEQQSHTLVMLTNCVESGRVKCEHYWPLDSQPCTHGHLQVTLVNEEVTENWTIRDLKLFHMEEQKALSVRQFHYIAWPDHGVPHSPDPLLAFWKVLRKWLDQNMGGGPPIVHCSAGVGRTGTLIALDVLIRQLECEGLVGPFNFVRKMRGSRPLMIQTEAQYVFLHQCILRFMQQSTPDPEDMENTYENVADLLYENVATIQNHKQETSVA